VDGGVPGKCRVDGIGKGSGWVCRLVSAVVGGSGGLSRLVGGDEELDGLVWCLGLGVVGVRLGLLLPRGTSILPLTMGAEVECWGLSVCLCSIQSIVLCWITAGHCWGVPSTGGWECMMGPVGLGGSETCVQSSSVGKYSIEFSGVRALSASSWVLYSGHSLSELLCEGDLQFMQ